MSGPLTKLRRAAGRARRYLEKRVLILLYHRVAESDLDPWALTVTPDHFAEHLQVMREYGRVMTLDGLSAGVASGNLPRRSIVVTFDDGYADNLANAKPLLERYDVPATVFITTGYLGKDREYWWDELERLLLLPTQLPDTLTLSVNGSQSSWQLGKTADDARPSSDAGWRAWSRNSPSPRHSLYRSLWQMMHAMHESERSQIRNDLLKWAGAIASARPTHRPLSVEQTLELADGGLVDVGCHTVTHSRLSALSVSEQREEIHGSKVRLEEILNRPVKLFAYPYGGESDYTFETATLVQDEGFDCGCATAPGVVGRNSERFRLPRVQVDDIDGEAFDRVLSRWLRD